MPAQKDPGTEIIVCDTTVVSVMQSVPPKRLATAWGEDILDRLNNGVLAITPFTVAELRAGHIAANWSAERRQEAETALAPYLTISVTPAVIDRWAEAWADLRRQGKPVPHNDLWIAATALARNCPLASCDGHFDYIAGLGHIHLPRPAPPKAQSPPRHNLKVTLPGTSLDSERIRP